MRGRIREWVEGRERKAQVEAPGGEADAFKAEGEEASAEARERERAFAGGTSPGGIGLVELGGGNGLSGVRGALLFEEEGERVLIFLKGGGGVLDAEGFSRGFGPPELKAGDGPVKNGGEGELELVGELGGLVAIQGEGERDGLEILVERGKSGRELGKFG